MPTTLSYSSRVSLSPAVLLKLLVLEEEREMLDLPFSFSLMNGLGRGETKGRAPGCPPGCDSRDRPSRASLEQSCSYGDEPHKVLSHRRQEHRARQQVGAAGRDAGARLTPQ